VRAWIETKIDEEKEILENVARRVRAWIETKLFLAVKK